MKKWTIKKLSSGTYRIKFSDGFFLELQKESSFVISYFLRLLKVNISKVKQISLTYDMEQMAELNDSHKATWSFPLVQSQMELYLFRGMEVSPLHNPDDLIPFLREIEKVLTNSILNK